MSDWRSLETWLCLPQRHRHVVAFDANATVNEPAFRVRVAAWWQTLRALSGQPVAIHLDDAVEFAAALLAAWHARCQVVLPGDLHAATVKAIGQHAAHWIGPLPNSLAPSPDASEPVWEPWSPADASLTLFTSGSQGTPQAIEKRASQLLDEVTALQHCFGAQLGQARVFSTVSQQHIYGLLFRVLWPLSAGRPFARERLAFPEDIACQLASARSVLISTPAHLSRLPDTIDWTAASASLCAVFSSGGPLSEAAATLVQRCLGQPATEVYGSSETGGIAWRQRLVETTHWRSLPGVQWRIYDGRLQVSSTFADTEGKWLATEDLAAPSGEGFDLLGRCDRIVKIEERRVSLAAVEQALLTDEGVSDARVLLLPGARMVLGAVIVDAGCAELRDAASRRSRAQGLRRMLEPVADRACWPKRWRFVSQLPCDARGKTTEALLRRLFAPAQPKPVWMLRQPQHIELECDLGGDLGPFDGHFPDTPVLPGVALLDWAARWGREQFCIAGEFVAIEQLKFQRIARPGMRLHMRLEFEPGSGRLGFSVHSALGRHASGRLRFAPA